MIRFILILISLFVFTWFTFAGNDIQAVNTWVYSFLNILDVLWLPLAILAGKLFTNDFVYGTFMHMDLVLWKIWNFSKSVSLIILGFVLIYSIFGLFVWKTKNIWDNLLKIAFAGVLIPVSWFLIGVLVDLSTLLLVAVGSFPMKIISNQNTPTVNVKYCQDIYLNPTLKFTTAKDITECKKEWGNINDFISKMNNLAGPLLYIGQSILYLDHDWGIIDKKQLEQKNQDPLKAVSLAVFFKLVVLALFVAPLFALVLVWLIRIFWLWIYIGFSPFIILDQVFGWKLLWKKEYFKFSNMVWLIFQPVFVVFAMWVALIFLSTLRNIMVVDHTSWKTSPWLTQLGVCENNPNSFCVGDTPVITVAGNLMKSFLDNVGGFFGYLIFILLVTMILFSLLKVASKASSITSSVVDRVYKFTTESLMAVPIIPTSRWPVSLWAVNMLIKRKDILTKWLETQAAESSDRLTKAIYDMFWIKNYDLSVSELKEWEEEISTIKDSKTLIRKFKNFISDVVNSKDHENMIIANSPHFKKIVYDFLNAALKVDSTAKAEFDRMEILDKDKKHLLSLDRVFDSHKFRAFLYNVFEKWNDLYEAPNFSSLVSTLPTTGDPNFVYKKLGDVFKK